MLTSDWAITVMEDLYFGLFLLFLAALFLFVWSKARVGKKHDKSSFRVRPTGRLIDSEKLERGQHRTALPRMNTISAVDAHRSEHMWRTRRQRATEQKPKKPDSSDGAIYAHYVSDQSGVSDRRVQDQAISDAEHVSIGEYLAKQAQDAAPTGTDQEEFTMTAVKYESGESEAGKDQQNLKKSGTKD